MFDFSIVDWSDDSSPFDQPESSSSSWEEEPLSCSSTRTCTVRFAQEDEVFDHIHRNDFTEEDIDATWFRPHEFREMRNSILQAVHQLEQQPQQQRSVESDTTTVRGLEARTSEGGMKRSKNKREAYASVLGEQERQWISRREDPERIAAAYQVVSSKCQGMALLRGVQDEREIREYVRPDNTSTESPSSTVSVSSTISISSTSSSESAYPSKPCEVEMSCQRLAALMDEVEITYRRLAVLEDIKILSGSSRPAHSLRASAA